MRVSTIYVKPDGRRSIVHHAPAVDQADSAPVHRVSWNARVVLFDGYQPELSRAVFEALVPGETVTVLDAGSVRKGTGLLARRVDHLVASRTFAHDFTGQEDPAAMAEALGRIAPVAVVTLGPEGVVYSRRDRNGGRAQRVPAPAISPVVDTTGAGDAFHAGYCAGLAWGLPFDEILDLAQACGAAACTRLGARPSMPGRSELSRLTLWDGLPGRS